jgi:acetyl esterase/lipase
MLRLFLAFCALSFGAIQSFADSMPPDVAEKIAALGRVVAAPQTGAIYQPLQPHEPYAGVKVTRDLKYGPSDLNALDVFQAENAGGAARSVLVLFHGGAFVGGNKKVGASSFTDNVLVWAANNGMVGVNANYRLAPAAQWPAGTEDVAATVKWIKENISKFGGDASRIILVGFSAGGYHVASYLAFPQFSAARGGSVAGAVLLSAAPIDASVSDMSAYKVYFGEDASKYAERSVASGLLKTPTPLLVSRAGLDPPLIEKDSLALVDALCGAGRCPVAVLLKTHSHMSEIYAIGTKDTELSDQILAFVGKIK